MQPQSSHTNPVDIHESSMDLIRNPSINKWFKACVKFDASDMHLKAGAAPAYRVKGDLRRVQEPPLSHEQIDEMVFEILSPVQRQYYMEHGAIDFAHDLDGTERFRVNVFRQRGHSSVAARRVNSRIRSFEELRLPPAMKRVCEMEEGLVLLAGITGSGKSTTLATIIDTINRNRAAHIVTIEDPIEFLFEDKKSVISQREIGIDVKDFHEALKYLMREDPDVVLIGELRDVETFEAAVHAAETGHLVFGTVHASSAAQTITRILDLFPEAARPSVRQALVFNLKAVINQKLLPTIIPGVTRVPACEIMFVNPPIRKMIEEGRDYEITAILRNSRTEGMQDFTSCLLELVESEAIDPKVAYEVAPNADELKMMLKGIRTK